MAMLRVCNYCGFIYPMDFDAFEKKCSVCDSVLVLVEYQTGYKDENMDGVDFEDDTVVGGSIYSDDPDIIKPLEDSWVIKDEDIMDEDITDEDITDDTIEGIHLIKPGQIWIEKNTPAYNGTNVYITKSKEPDEDWELICFQEWTMGGYLIKGDYTDSGIRNKMTYLGHIDDILNIQYIQEQLSNIKFHSGKFSIRYWWLTPKRYLAKEVKWINSVVNKLLEMMNNKEKEE